MTIVRTTARAMLGAIFVFAGSDAMRNPDKLAVRAKPVTDRVGPALQRIHPGLPAEAATMVQINGAVQVGAGLLMITPLHRPAALALAASLIPTTLAGHPFWTYDDPAERVPQRNNFLKNAGLFGGLVLSAMDTEGRPGLRWRAGHYADHARGAVRRTARTTRSKARIARKSAAAGHHIPDWPRR